MNELYKHPDRNFRDDKMVEILCNGIVHYRRPAGHPDIAEAERLIADGYCPAYSINCDA